MNAETVEIEEFYDRSGSASLGAETNGQVMGLGLSAEGKSVTRRVFHFKGYINRGDEEAKVPTSPV